MTQMNDMISKMMSQFVTFIILVLILRLLADLLKQKIRKKRKQPLLRLIKNPEPPSVWDAAPEPEERREYYFERRAVMTEAEKSFFIDIVRAVPEFYVFPQVSFLALLDPTGQASLGKIQNKRVDFVVCDIKTNRYCVIELDDRSHFGKRKKDLERDGFFDSAGIHSLRYRTNNKPSVDALREDIYSNLS